MMKKILLTAVFSFTLFFSAKAQMIIHGTDATRFYLWDANASTLYRITADEIWWDVAGATPGLLSYTNLSFTSAGNYFSPDGFGYTDPGDRPIACWEAQSALFGHGKCGPLAYQLTPPYSMTCVGSNNNGCMVRMNGVIYWSSNGDF
jgi:hypothetical protein